MTPDSRPLTRPASPIAARSPASRAALPIGPSRSVVVHRAARPVWNTRVATFRPPSFARLPTGKAAPVLLDAPTTVLARSGSYRAIAV